jgi:MFS family permease
VYASAIGLALTIPALYLIGVGQSIEIAIGAALLYGFGFGMFDANNMPILCQLVPSHLRATGYGVMNMGGVFAGAFTTYYLGKSFDAGNINRDIIFLSVIVAVAIVLQLLFLHPKPQDQIDP